MGAAVLDGAPRGHRWVLPGQSGIVAGHPMSLFDRVGAGLTEPGRMRVYPVMLVTVPLAVWGCSVAGRTGLVDRDGHILGADFAAFYMAGTFAREGRIDALASAAAQSDFQHALVAPVVVSGFTPWINPPFVAFGFAPLAALPYGLAIATFWALGLATFLGTVAVGRRFLGLTLGLPRLWLLAASYFPTLAWFMFGQTSALSLALMTASVAALLRGSDLSAGLLLGCFAWKPQLALAMGLALILARRWRAVLGAWISGSALFGLSVWLAPDATRAWLVGSPALLAFIRQAVYPMWGLASLFGASALLLDGVSRPLAGLVGGTLTAVAVLLLARLWRAVPWRPGHPSFRLALAATVAATVLVSPHLYFYDLMLLLLPAALALHALSDDTAEARAPIVAATAWVYFLGLPSPYLALGQQMLARRLTGQPAALQLETVAIAIWAWRVGRRAVAVV